VVQNGGTLAGIALWRPVFIQNGGTLAPGDASLGALTINNAVTLGRLTLMELTRQAQHSPIDRLAGITSLATAVP